MSALIDQAVLGTGGMGGIVNPSGVVPDQPAALTYDAMLDAIDRLTPPTYVLPPRVAAMAEDAGLLAGLRYVLSDLLPADTVVVVDTGRINRELRRTFRQPPPLSYHFAPPATDWTPPDPGAGFRITGLGT